MAAGSPGNLQENPATGFVAWAHAIRMGGTVAVVVKDPASAADAHGTTRDVRRKNNRATRIVDLENWFIQDSLFMGVCTFFFSFF